LSLVAVVPKGRFPERAAQPHRKRSSDRSIASEADAELAEVIEAWPALSREKRELVLGVVRI
jgi:hypothetical protein